MDWFLYDNGLRLEKVKITLELPLLKKYILLIAQINA